MNQVNLSKHGDQGPGKFECNAGSLGNRAQINLMVLRKWGPAGFKGSEYDTGEPGI